MITRANLFDTSSTCFFTMRFFFWVFSSTLIEDQSPTDGKKRLQVRHSDLSQTLVVLNSCRGDGTWHSGYADWKNVSSRPNQQRLWMCTTCGHYNSSKAACSQCRLRRSWTEVVKGVKQTNSATPPSQPKEEIKALEAALAALPDNVDLFGKVRAPLEERLQHARKEARDSKPLCPMCGRFSGISQRVPTLPSTMRLSSVTLCSTRATCLRGD